MKEGVLTGKMDFRREFAAFIHPIPDKLKANLIYDAVSTSEVSLYKEPDRKVRLL